MHGRRHVKEAGLQEEVVNLTLRAKKNDRGLPVSKSLGSPCVPAAALVLLCFRDLLHHGSRSFSVLTWSEFGFFGLHSGLLFTPY